MSLWPLIAASPNLQTARAPTQVVFFTHWPLLVCNSPSALGERRLLLHAVIERAITASLLQPRTTEKQQQLRHSRLSIHPSTCFSLCHLALPVNHSLSLRSIGSSKEPQTGTNLCALIGILALTHPSSVYPVLKPFHWCIDSHYTPHTTPLSTGESSLTGSWMPETTGSTKLYYKYYVYSNTVHSTYDKV